MLERYMDLIFDPATGRFDFSAFRDKYSPGTTSDYRTGCPQAIQHLMMYGLFGDPSLRVGGVRDIEDHEHPTTTLEVHGDGTRSVEVKIRATDTGDPASGVRRVKYTIDRGEERFGTRFVVEGDGDHEVWYQAEDYAENTESPSHWFNVHVDGVDPVTRIVSVDGPTGSLMDCGCSGDACYPPHGCFSGNVTVTMEGTDGDSGVGFIEYYYPGMPAGLLGLTRFYDGPFEIPEPTDAPSLTLSYRAVDAGGNAEPWKEATICFCSPWTPSFMGSRLTIDPPLEGTISWALLEERIPDPSDIQMVAAAYAVPGPGNPEWIVAAVDSEGKDGWKLAWDTTKLRDGKYLAQLAVYGFPAKPGGQPLLLHSDSRSVTICNIPAAQYHFTLDAPDEVPLGAWIPFTIKFSHKFQGDVAAAVLTCDLDPKLFERIDVLDGGTLDKRGRPTWLRGKLASDELWTARFRALLHKDIAPGALLATRAFLTAEGVALLVSDDPSTPGSQDPTGVKVLPTPAELEVLVRDDRIEAPLKAAVTLHGPVDRTETTGEDGSCRFAGLAPGAYQVAVDSPGREYASPPGPLTLSVKGVGESLKAEFFLRSADRLPPVSSLSIPAQEIVERRLSDVSGTAVDEPGGSGVAKVELSVRRIDDGMWWNGQAWTERLTWLSAKGRESWDVALGAIVWKKGASHAIASRARDRAGNVESPHASRGGVPDTPALLSPQNGSTVAAAPTFRWSAVPGCAYHLQVAAGADFQSPVIDAAGIAACAFTPPALPAGRWAWRVRAIRMTPVEHGEDEHLVPQDIEGPPEASAWTASWKLIRKGGEFQRGDSNADARTDISDAVAVLGHLFLGGKINDCADAADTNDDGKVDISDPVRLLGHLFLGAERPPDPFQACGTDPTEDDLDCASYPGCP